MLTTRVNKLKDLFDYLNYTKPKITIGDTEYMVEKEDIVDTLGRFIDTECIDAHGLDRPAKHFPIKDNILFLDPDTGIIKPQSRLDMLAIASGGEKCVERGRLRRAYHGALQNPARATRPLSFCS